MLQAWFLRTVGIMDYGHPMNPKKSEILSRCGRQNMLQSYLKIRVWDLIFDRAVKAIFYRGPWEV